MKYSVRQANIADHDPIFALFAQSVRPYVEPIWGWDEDYQRRDFDESFVLSQFWVIEVDGYFAGFMQTYTDSDVTELCEIHLLPEYRGQGIGSSVIRNLLPVHGTLRTGCFKANMKAYTLYQRLGFRLTAETETHYLLEYHV